MIEINKKQDCCGCTACEAICPKDAIVMKEDNEGFLYPTVDKSRCVECNACYMVCPIQSPVTEEEKPQKAYLVQHSDEKVRLDSSASQWLLSQRGYTAPIAIQRSACQPRSCE